MRIADFDYDLPAERIAQHPAAERDASRLLVLDRGKSAPIEHASFREIGRYLAPGDLLVLNETRVLPARLVGSKETGGRIELLLVERESAPEAEASTIDDIRPAAMREPMASAIDDNEPVAMREPGASAIDDIRPAAMREPGASAIDNIRPAAMRQPMASAIDDTRPAAMRDPGVREAGARGEQHAPCPGARTSGEVWLCIAGFSRSPAPRTRLNFGPELEAFYLGPSRAQMHRVSLRAARGGDLRAALEAAGRMPLPPYIQRNGDPSVAREDAARYQTVFAAKEGAIAAPTAGLHFTNELLERLASSGIGTARVTLHVGPATFLPIRTEEIEDHPMPGERYEVPREASLAIARTRERGGRIVAVGTTVVRALESASDGRRGVLPVSGRTDLYIYPGHRFRAVDALLTNFHLPRSTLLALVSAFAGKERVLDAYREAIAAGYRFYSFGDAMLIL